MLDRALQRTILERLNSVFPEKRVIAAVAQAVFNEESASNIIKEDISKLRYNLAYLAGHGLVDEYDKNKRGHLIESHYSISSAGIDFLEDDGGLSAILNVVTVKFDADNLRSLIEQGLYKADLPEEKRSSIREAVRNMPSSALQSVTSKLIEKAMDDPMGALKIVAATLGMAL